MNREYDDTVVRYPEIQRVRKTHKDGTPSLATHSRKCQRMFDDPCHGCVDFGAKLVAKPGAPRFVPATGVERLGLGLRPEKRRTRHPFFNSLRRTSDHGTADPGFARCSAHRRSISAA